MEGGRGQLEQLQQSGDPACGRDGIDEDQGAAGVGRQQIIQMLVTLLITAADTCLLHLRRKTTKRLN